MKKNTKFRLFTIFCSILPIYAFIKGIVLGNPVHDIINVLSLVLAFFLSLVILAKIYKSLELKRRVRLLLNEDLLWNPSVSYADLATALKSQNISAQYKRVFKILKNSNLNISGNPIYTLPWFIVLGTSNSDKTHAIEKASLPDSAFSHGSQISGHFNWSFYNTGLAIDIPSKYLDDSNHASYAKWISFLYMLKKYRAKEPLNGIVVAVASDWLLDASEKELAQNAKLFRDRIDYLKKLLKLKMPVILMITRCELLKGFTKWSNILTKDHLKQAMGFFSADKKTGENIFFDKAINLIIEKIQNITLKFNGPISPDVLSLPNRIRQLKEPVERFSQLAFKGNLSNKSSDLSGIYFTGIENKNTDNKNIDNEQPLFLHDVFASVLPSTRGMAKSRLTQGNFKKAIKGLFFLITLGAFLLLFTSYTSNVNILKNACQQSNMSYNSQADFDTKINILGKTVNNIVNLENEIKNQIISWHGKNPKFIDDIKQTVVVRFKTDLLARTSYIFKNNVDSHIKDLQQNKEIQTSKTGQLIQALIIKKIFIEELSKQYNKQKLLKLDQPFLNHALYFPEKTTQSSVEKFNELYYVYLEWSDPSKKLKREKIEVNKSLSKILNAAGSNFAWIIPFANKKIDNVKPVYLSDFWMGQEGSAIFIPKIFTPKGRKFVENFIQELLEKQNNAEELLVQKKAFFEKYEKEYLKAWENFASNFQKGTMYLNGRADWSQVIDGLAYFDKNPYFKALDVIYQNILPCISQESKDQWIKDLIYYQKAKAHPQKENNNTDRIAKAANALFDYQESFKLIKGISNKPTLSFKSMADYFTDSGVAKVNPDVRLTQSAEQFKLYLDDELDVEDINLDDKKSNAFWKLYTGPIAFIREFMLNETSCQLQQKWEDTFLASIEKIPQYRLQEFIFEHYGKAWEFISDHASPFLVSDNGKYRPKKHGDYEIQFKQDFFDFLSQSSNKRFEVKNSYNVTTKFISVKTNNVAIKATAALMLDCTEYIQVLRYSGSPVVKTFIWAKRCGNVILSLGLGPITLEKIYSSFPEFAKDFRYGSKRFTARDFPFYKSKLMAMGVSHIDVNFELIGHEPLIQPTNKSKVSIPKFITYCWERPESSENEESVLEPEDNLKKEEQEKEKEKSDLKLTEQADLTDLTKTTAKTTAKTMARTTVSKTDHIEPIQKTQSKAEDMTSITQTDLKPLTESKTVKIEPKVLTVETKPAGIQQEPLKPKPLKTHLIQAASYRRIKDAIKKVNKFEEKAIKAKIYWLQDSRGGKWYIVTLGEFYSLKEVNAAIKEFRRKHKIDSIVRTLDTKTLESRKVEF